MRSCQFLALGFTTSVILAGCGTGNAIPVQNASGQSPTGGTSGGAGTDQDATGANGADSTGTGFADLTQPPGGAGGTSTATTAELAAAAAVTSAKTVAEAVAAILPLKDLQAIFESGQALPSCPSLTTGELASPLAVTLDYGTGCRPGPFPQFMFTGTTRGEFFTAFNAFTMDLSSTSIGGETITGTISGSVAHSQGMAEFFGSLDARVGDSDAVRGSFAVSMAESSGAITITGASLTVSSTSGDARSIDLQATVIDAATNGNFSPSAGTATVNGSAGGNPTLDHVTFTSQTPVDGTVSAR